MIDQNVIYAIGILVLVGVCLSAFLWWGRINTVAAITPLEEMRVGAYGYIDRHQIFRAGYRASSDCIWAVQYNHPAIENPPRRAWIWSHAKAWHYRPNQDFVLVKKVSNTSFFIKEDGFHQPELRRNLFCLGLYESAWINPADVTHPRGNTTDYYIPSDTTVHFNPVEGYIEIRRHPYRATEFVRSSESRSREDNLLMDKAFNTAKFEHFSLSVATSSRWGTFYVMQEQRENSEEKKPAVASLWDFLEE